MAAKKNFLTHIGGRRNKNLLSMEKGEFIAIRDIASTAGQLPDYQGESKDDRVVMSVFITQVEEQSSDTPADRLIGWGKDKVF